MKILVLDNYDSFTYNLVEYLRKLTNQTIVVERNDEIALEAVALYDKIILSPGPGLPEEAGILKALIQEYGATKSILGVCLGHQAIAEVYGGELENPAKVYHGIATKAKRTTVSRGILHNLPDEFEIGRYHSWNVASERLPDCFEVTCYDEEGMIMGMIHKEHDVEGIQFHPESVLTPLGLKMIENWLNF